MPLALQAQKRGSAGRGQLQDAVGANLGAPECREYVLEFWGVASKSSEFVPECDQSVELYKVLKETMNIDKILAVEVDHCP